MDCPAYRDGVYGVCGRAGWGERSLPPCNGDQCCGDCEKLPGCDEVCPDLPRGREVKPKVVELGQLVATPGALEKVPPDEMLVALGRHARGDWGDLCGEDRRLNDAALKNGERLLSSYRTRAGTKFWIITEWDRSVTTVLLPEEY